MESTRITATAQTVRCINPAVSRTVTDSLKMPASSETVPTQQRSVVATVPVVGLISKTSAHKLDNLTDKCKNETCEWRREPQLNLRTRRLELPDYCPTRITCTPLLSCFTTDRITDTCRFGSQGQSFAPCFEPNGGRFFCQSRECSY